MTTFVFTAAASDPDGDTLTYNWSFVDLFHGEVATASGNPVDETFQVDFPLLEVKARVTVTDGRGGSATGESLSFVVGNMTGDWMVGLLDFPPFSLYLTLRQTSAGIVTGKIKDSLCNQIGQTDPASFARIAVNGRLTGLRLKFDAGGDLTIDGRMEPTLDDAEGRRGLAVDGTVVASSGLVNGVPVPRGTPVFMGPLLGSCFPW